MIDITLTGLMVDGEINHRVSLLYESCYLFGHDRQLLPKSTAFWVAVGRRLIAFFGGGLAYDDCGRKVVDEYETRCLPYPTEADDDGYVAMRRRIAELQPITSEEMHTASARAHYGYDH
jgi:hypothetical protein